jgi:hypothetical protein
VEFEVNSSSRGRKRGVGHQLRPISQTVALLATG